MTKFVLLLSILFSGQVLSQAFLETDLGQSSSSINWKTIENDHVQLIYPDYLGSDSDYIANLIEHYSKVVGLTYGITNPKKVPIIIRPEVAQPNGFVGLAPRRSEWFSSSMFSTSLGSAEWYQTLAIHEYRHVQQFDHFNMKTIKFLSWLFGDTGQMIGTFIGTQPWLFEGDAVWAETKYTDTGRGRAPQFLSRLKALVTSDQIPTYDELVNGSYNTRLPNHYPFGYILISSATKKFGEDFWKKVAEEISYFPHPYRLYHAFKHVSGQDFFKFYDETMNELKTTWSKDIKGHSENKVDYRENTSPFNDGKSTYYLHYSMDTYWTLYKKTGVKKEVVAEIPFSKGMSKIDIRGEQAIYSQFLPNARYGYKGSSDLVLINLKTGEQSKITSGKRLYNPRFSKDNKSILVSEFNDDLKWTLSEYDLKGEKVFSTSFGKDTLVEVYPLNSNEVMAILADPAGYKYISKMNLKTKKSNTILPKSRNNISSLYISERNETFFEAQYKGVTEIFKITADKMISKCTDVDFNATSPSANNQNIFYSNEDAYGSHIKVTPITKCSPIKSSELVDYNYLGQNPSDNYNNFAPVLFKDQVSLRQSSPKKYSSENYGDLDKALITPHSWSFFAGNGFGLSANTNNYLNTMGIFAQIGKDGNEDQNYTQFSMSYSEFYPVFQISGEIRNREVDFFNSEDILVWKEKQAGLSMTLPYTYKKNLYTFTNALTFSGKYVDTRKYKATVSRPTYGNRYFKNSSVEFYTDLSKDLTARSIMSPWSFGYFAKYENAEGNIKDRDSSYRFFHSGKVQVPGFFNHDGFKFTYSEEKQKNDINSYRFLPTQFNRLGNVFSRGYKYESIPHYQKVTANYAFPLATPDFDLWGIYYLRRATINTFFDSTKLESNLKNDTYNSTGLELELESKFFRILPISFGARYVHKLKAGNNLGEVYTATSLEF